MNPDVTIVVTVHNAAKFLRECMDSVCGQTYKNIEIICVDGGSTDNSASILNEYSQKDERIKIINDTNTSYGHKVNIGIEEAKGQYIGILESDDMLKPDMVHTPIPKVTRKMRPILKNIQVQYFVQPS